MAFFRRRNEDLDIDDEVNDAGVDPELRLRTVRTAASTIAESIRQEQRQERRKSMRKKGSRFFRRGAEKRKETADSDSPPTTAQIPGRRRNVYVNVALPMDELDHNGEPIARYARNKVRTSSEYHLGMSIRVAIQSFPRVHDHHVPPQEPLRAISSVSTLFRLSHSSVRCLERRHGVSPVDVVCRIPAEGQFWSLNAYLYTLRPVKRRGPPMSPPLEIVIHVVNSFAYVAGASTFLTRGPGFDLREAFKGVVPGGSSSRLARIRARCTVSPLVEP